MHSATRRQDVVFSTSPFRPEVLEQHFGAIKEHLPWLKLEGTRRYADSLTGAALSFGSEGLYLVPQWQKVANDRLTATRRIISILKELHGFNEWGESVFVRLRTQDRTLTMLGMLAEEQGDNDVVVIPAQLGHFHANRSVDKVRNEFFDKEFGLGLFEVACMLLLNPSRLVFENHLSIDCAGDNCYPGMGPDSASAPYFSADSEGTLELSERLTDVTSMRHGSATGFLI